MRIENGVAYPDHPIPVLKVREVFPMEDYLLRIRFNTEETKLFDFKPLLQTPVYSPLRDKALFSSVTVDYGCPVWNAGEIDIAPEYLYEKGI